MNDSIDLKVLIKNGVQFGHQTSKWNPKMAPFIYGSRNKIHLIDVSKTAHQLAKAAKFLEQTASEGRPILLVGTKKAAQNSILKLAKDLNLSFVNRRWVGGTFSNPRQVRKSVTNLLHYKDILSKASEHSYLKKELNVIMKKADRLEKIVGGISNLPWPVGAVVVVDVKKEHVCVKEAIAAGVPIVALVDTNSDPSGIEFVIPANDDAPRSVDLLMDFLGEAIKRGQAVAVKTKAEVINVADAFESVFGLTPEEEEEAAKPKRRKGGPVVKASAPRAKVAKKPIEPEIEAAPAEALEPEVEKKAEPRKKIIKAKEEIKTSPKTEIKKSE